MERAILHVVECAAKQCRACHLLRAPSVVPPPGCGSLMAPFRCRLYGELKFDEAALRSPDCLAAERTARRVVGQLATSQCQQAHGKLTEALTILQVADAKTNGVRSMRDELSDDELKKLFGLLKTARAMIPAEEQSIFAPVLYHLRGGEEDVGTCAAGSANG